MTAHPITWAIAALIAVLLATAHLLDGPDDIATIQAVEADVHDAQEMAEVASK